MGMLMSGRAAPCSCPIHPLSSKDNLRPSSGPASRTTALAVQRHAIERLRHAGVRIDPNLNPNIGVFDGLHVAPDCHQLAGRV